VTPFQRFGIDIDVHRSTIAVGAPGRPSEDSSNPSSRPENPDNYFGAVYLFDRVIGGDGGWEQTAVITPDDPNDFVFGLSVELEDHVLAVTSAFHTTLYEKTYDASGNGLWTKVWRSPSSVDMTMGTRSLVLSRQSSSGGTNIWSSEPDVFVPPVPGNLVAPVVFADDAIGLSVGETSNHVIFATGDGPPMYFSGDSRGASLDDNGNGTRSFVWTPTSADRGENRFTIVVENPLDARVFTRWVLTVTVQ